MSGRMWAWGFGLLAFGAIVLAVDAHAIHDFRPAVGTDQAATLGQVIGLVVSGALIVAAALVLGTGVRRRLERRRHRRLRDRLAARDDLRD